VSNGFVEIVYGLVKEGSYLIHKRKDILLKSPVDVDTISNITEFVVAGLHGNINNVEILFGLLIEFGLRLIALEDQPGTVVAEGVYPAICDYF
jgi:hypothetical protein